MFKSLHQICFRNMHASTKVFAKTLQQKNVDRTTVTIEIKILFNRHDSQSQS